MAGNSSEQGRGVISKAVAVLEAFCPDRHELTLNQIAEHTGLPLSTAYRTVGDLVFWGALERVDGGGYRVGLRLFEIGSLAERASSLLPVVVPIMQDVYVDTRDSVQLAVRDGNDVLLVEKIYGARSAPVQGSRGSRLPLHATASGKLLLAHGPRELVDKTVAAGLPRFTPHTLTTGPQLHRALDEVRRTGVAIQQEELNPGLCSVAAPVRDADGVVVAALGTALRTSGHRLRQSTAFVRTAAAAASRELSRV